MRRSRGKISYQQKLVYLDFVKNNPKFLLGKLQPEYNSAENNNLWRDLIGCLNSISSGPKKTKMQWKNGIYEWLVGARRHFKESPGVKLQREDELMLKLSIKKSSSYAHIQSVVSDCFKDLRNEPERPEKESSTHAEKDRLDDQQLQTWDESTDSEMTEPIGQMDTSGVIEREEEADAEETQGKPNSYISLDIADRSSPPGLSVETGASKELLVQQLPQQQEPVLDNPPQQQPFTHNSTTSSQHPPEASFEIHPGIPSTISLPKKTPTPQVTSTPFAEAGTLVDHSCMVNNPNGICGHFSFLNDSYVRYNQRRASDVLDDSRPHDQAPAGGHPVQFPQACQLANKAAEAEDAVDDAKDTFVRFVSDELYAIEDVEVFSDAKFRILEALYLARKELRAKPGPSSAND